MATRRCLSTKIVCTDSYAELSYAEQSMYIQLYMSADDDGIVIGPKLITARYRGGKVLIQSLVEKGYLLLIDGVYIIAHWRVANTLQSDRLKPLDNPEVAKKIWIKPNRMYTDQFDSSYETLYNVRSMTQLESKCFPKGNITKSNLTKANITKSKISEPNSTAFWDSEMYFQELINRYPSEHVGDLGTASMMYRNMIITQEDAEQALDMLDLWTASEQWAEENGKYIPDLFIWIAKRCWKYMPATSGIDGRYPEEYEVNNI